MQRNPPRPLSSSPYPSSASPVPPASSSSASASPAAAALRRTLRTPVPNHEDEDDVLADPRPWESHAHPRTYGSKDKSTAPDLPLYTPASGMVDENEARRRYGEKESAGAVSEKEDLLDDQGKWAKGHGAGPGFGGRRGLPPRQRLTGWVSLSKGRGLRSD